MHQEDAVLGRYSAVSRELRHALGDADNQVAVEQAVPLVATLQRDARHCGLRAGFCELFRSD